MYYNFVLVLLTIVCVSVSNFALSTLNADIGEMLKLHKRSRH